VTIKWNEVESLSGESFSTLINVSGRQRMLSQRIIMLILNCQFLCKENLNSNLTESLTLLENTIDIFKTNHFDLLNGNKEKKLPRLPSEKLITKLKDEGVEELIEEFIKQVDEFKNRIKESELINPDELDSLVMHAAKTVLKHLNELTEIYEAEFHEYSAFQRDESLKQELRIQQKEQARNELANLNAVLEEKILERTKDLKASESRVRAVLDNITEGIAVVDSNGIIQTVNPAVVEMFNYQESELKSTCFSKLLSKINSPFDDFKDSNNRIKIADFISANGRHDFECVAVQYDGTKFPIESVFNAMPVDEKTLYIWVVRDISARKEAEARLEQAQQELRESAHQSGMAEIATGVLHNIGNILNSVSLSAEEVNRLLKEFKFPMLDKATSMLVDNRENLAEFLGENQKGDKLVDYLVVINESFEKDHVLTKNEIEHMKTHIAMIKDVISTQQEYAKGNHFSEAVDINRLLEDAIKIEKNSLNKNFISITNKAAKMPDCEVHKSKLLQVMTNLIKNAKEATLENGYIDQREIFIESGVLDSQFAYVRIKDNGVGITEENLAKIFQHGFTTKQSGHGFGLHSSVVAMKEMNGNISAESGGINQGTVFTVTVPLARS